MFPDRIVQDKGFGFHMLCIRRFQVTAFFSLILCTTAYPAGIMAAWRCSSSKAQKKRAPKAPAIKKAKADADITKQDPAGADSKLTAVVCRWGNADWVFHSAGTLWQVQVRQQAGGSVLGHMGFRMNLTPTVMQALRRHPRSPEVCNLKTLFSAARVKVLNGAPPVDGKRNNDPDNMNVKDWEPVLYAAGEVPYEALTVVHLVMEEKVRFGLLPKMPAMHLVWAMGPGEEPPEAKPPACWTPVREEVSGQKPDCKPIFQMSCPFKVPPPLGRQHILAHLQVAEDGDKKYTLTFSGGLYYFRNEFNKAKITGCQANHPRTGVADYLRFLDSQDGPNAFQAKVAAILNDVLGGIPVLLTHEVLEVEDSFL